MHVIAWLTDPIVFSKYDQMQKLEKAESARR